MRLPEAGARVSEPGVPTPAVYADLIAPELIDPDAVKVLRRISRHEHTAYLVGGGVRDLLLGRAPKDFDIATSARPNEMRRLFRNCRIIGRRFRLAHILFGGAKIIEVATFRRDPTQREGGTALAFDEEGDGPSLWPAPKERGDEAARGYGDEQRRPTRFLGDCEKIDVLRNPRAAQNGCRDSTDDRNGYVLASEPAAR